MKAEEPPQKELRLSTKADPKAPLPAVAEVRRRGFMTGIELAAFPVEARGGAGLMAAIDPVALEQVLVNVHWDGHGWQAMATGAG